MHPYYFARAFGGLLFLIGGCIGAYNVWMTISEPAATTSRVGDIPQSAGGAGALQPAE
jgi:cytochrome c oxidase cbb3-type subunit 1